MTTQYSSIEFHQDRNLDGIFDFYKHYQALPSVYNSNRLCRNDILYIENAFKKNTHTKGSNKCRYFSVLIMLVLLPVILFVGISSGTVTAILDQGANIPILGSSSILVLIIAAFTFAIISIMLLVMVYFLCQPEEARSLKVLERTVSKINLRHLKNKKAELKLLDRGRKLQLIIPPEEKEENLQTLNDSQSGAEFLNSTDLRQKVIDNYSKGVRL